MKRKTFVKRMMGVGYSRNGANKQAARINRYGISYASRWETISSIRRPFLRITDGHLEAAEKAAEKAGTILQRAARQAVAALQYVSLSKLGIAAFEPMPAAEWEKMTHHHAGLRTHVALADELATSGPVLTNEQIMATAAKWPSARPVLHDHGYVSGADLAQGRDMTAYMPIIRADAVIIDPTDSRYIMRQKTATELACEIAEKLQPQGGGGHD